MSEQFEFDSRESSRRFIEIRTKAGLTQEELADKLGVALQTIKNYEKAGSINVKDNSSKDRVNAIAGMKIETLFKMAKQLGVSSDYLLGLTNVQTLDVNIRGIIQEIGIEEKNILRLIAWCRSLNNLPFTDIISEAQQEILDHSVWCTAEEVITFANGLLDAYLQNPRWISRSYRALTNFLRQWKLTLEAHSLHDVYCKQDDLFEELLNYGLTTTTTEDAAYSSLKKITSLLGDSIMENAKKSVGLNDDE